MYFIISLFLLCVMLAVPGLRAVALILLVFGGLAAGWFVMSVQQDNERAQVRTQAYDRGQYQLALACGMSDMELETRSGLGSEHWQCLNGVTLASGDLLWGGECGRVDSGPAAAWARCAVARYVKRCEFRLSQHAGTIGDFDNCADTQSSLAALKSWASN